MADKEFPRGLIVKRPHPNAPNFIKARVSIKRTELIEWLQSKDKDWINLDLANSKNNTLYFAVDDFEPKKQENETQLPENDEESDLPF